VGYVSKSTPGQSCVSYAGSPCVTVLHEGSDGSLIIVVESHVHVETELLLLLLQHLNCVLEPLRFVTCPAVGEQYQQTAVLAELQATCECHKGYNVSLYSRTVRLCSSCCMLLNGTLRQGCDQTQAQQVTLDRNRFLPYFIVVE
jgi:hypothetical protein